MREEIEAESYDWEVSKQVFRAELAKGTIGSGVRPGPAQVFTNHKLCFRSGGAWKFLKGDEGGVRGREV